MMSSFMSLSASPTPNSEPKPESGVHSPPPYLCCSLMCQCGHRLTVTMYEAGLQVSSWGQKLRDSTRLTQSHTAGWLLRLVFPNCSQLLLRAEDDSALICTGRGSSLEDDHRGQSLRVTCMKGHMP